MVQKADNKGGGKGTQQPQLEPSKTKLITAKTRKGRRILESRAPKLVEDAKRLLVLYGNKASQVLKDLLCDLHKLKAMESVKFTRRNEECRPFEVGGEQRLEFYANKVGCGLFAMGSHTKKRPHNLVLGRFFDGHLYDALELGVEGYKSIQAFGNAGTGAGLGNKPCVMFVGERFESSESMKLARSLILDLFRGQPVSAINLAGVDRVIVAYAVDENKLLLRQYVVKLKKSGTRVPRVVLVEMGPRLDFAVRRHRPPPPEIEKEALRQPQLGKKKEKNVESDLLEGKVGRIYVPSQDVDRMALAKPKGTKRQRHEDAAERKAKHKKTKETAGKEAAAASQQQGEAAPS
uniref:Ribosome production factor 2 homolog n=1 Tax=Dunaliella tertiolecta TaxID=3047 RepID=A0A7S3QW93_DUNTE|mmetsp:Transcript_1876/g.4783  ORF Transcript_1876/g.4783 Transcript_1876/m.4783 type:complete len:348 (+) Transcript_1876:40-1083(+)